MSFQQFADTQRIKVIETGELVACGGVSIAAHMEVAYMRAVLYKHGALAGTEKLRAKLFTDAALTKVHAASAWLTVSDISGLGTYWIGWGRLDFDREHWNKNQTLYAGVETTGYTRNGDTSYLGLVLDYGISQNDEPTAVAMAFYGYRWL